MHEFNRMLVIIPKTDKTVLGVFHEERCLYKKEIPFKKNDRSLENEIASRKLAVLETLNNAGINLSKFDAVSAIGGLLHPVEGGTYLVNKAMITDLLNSYNGKHPSNLGGIIAARIAEGLNIPAFIVDPPVVDEMDSIARYSGHRNVERKSIFHALNQKAAARRAARLKESSYRNVNFIVAHIGNGISVAAHQNGKVIDVNNGLHGDGPFSLERAGTIPLDALIDMCYDHTTTKEALIKDITYKSGLKGYAGVGSAEEVLQLIKQREPKTTEAVQAMGYQISKEIGAMAATLSGNVDAIVLTGELARLKLLTEFISRQVDWISDVLYFPGEADLQALNAGTLRVLREEEKPRIYEQVEEEGAKYEERI